MSGLFRAQELIDLHMHSTVSDGSDTPSAVVEAAHEAGVRTMALTDHDTTLGWEEAQEACAAFGMTFIPGAEISVTVGDRVGGMHLLAYLFDPLYPELSAAMKAMREGKLGRVSAMVDLIKPHYDVTLDEVVDIAGDAPPQRPHVAAALVARGHVETVSEAFEKILYSGGPFHLSTPKKPDIFAAIGMVRRAGGVPILAHPTARGPGVMPRHHLEALLEAGLGGLELDHQENARNRSGLATLWQYQRELDFIVTGSSDYHGTRKVNRPGDDSTTPEMLERLIDSARGASGSSGSEPIYPPQVA